VRSHRIKCRMEARIAFVCGLATVTSQDFNPSFIL
jgi:hypothetical protein